MRRGYRRGASRQTVDAARLATEINTLPKDTYLDEIQMLEGELDRTLTAVRYLDGKPVVLILAAGGIAGSVVFKALSESTGDSVYIAVMTLALMLLVACVIVGIRVIFPRLSLKAMWIWSRPDVLQSGDRSPHFFGHIAQFKTYQEYLERVTETCESRVLRAAELAKQIHVNATIAVRKSRLIGVSSAALQAAILLVLAGWTWHSLRPAHVIKAKPLPAAQHTNANSKSDSAPNRKVQKSVDSNLKHSQKGVAAHP